MRLRCWTLELNPYRYTTRIIHRSGKSNSNADALSRNPVKDRYPIDPPLVNTITTVQVRSDFLETIKQGYVEDLYFAPILTAFVNKEPHSHLSSFDLENGLIYRK